jgi:hypothetical protein
MKGDIYEGLLEKNGGYKEWSGTIFYSPCFN